MLNKTNTEESLAEPLSDFPVVYMWARLDEIQGRHKIKAIQMAKLAGMERTVWHRARKAQTIISTRSLFRLSHHFNLSMAFWFPPVDGSEIEPPAHRDCVCHGEAFLTKKVFRAIAKLPAVEKSRLYRLIEQSPDTPGYLMQIVELLGMLASSERAGVVRALKAYMEKVRPAP